MSEPAKISLGQQIEAVDFAIVRQSSLANGASIKGRRGQAAEAYDVKRLRAALRTLEWLAQHEAEIRAYLACHSKTAREAGLVMAVEIERREALAKAGGPVR
jgi:hypothetical protein